VNLPLARDDRQRRSGHSGAVEAKHHAVGVESPYARIDRAGQQLRYLEVRPAFCGLGDGGAIGFPHSELDPALPEAFWQPHLGRSDRRNYANPNHRLCRDLRIVRILRWVDQLSTRDIACSVSRVRYTGEAGMSAEGGVPEVRRGSP
jgi:hypothetical protein